MSCTDTNYEAVNFCTCAHIIINYAHTALFTVHSAFYKHSSSKSLTVEGVFNVSFMYVYVVHMCVCRVPLHL